MEAVVDELQAWVEEQLPWLKEDIVKIVIIFIDFCSNIPDYKL